MFLPISLIIHNKVYRATWEHHIGLPGSHQRQNCLGPVGTQIQWLQSRQWADRQLSLLLCLGEAGEEGQAGDLLGAHLCLSHLAAGGLEAEPLS